METENNIRRYKNGSVRIKYEFFPNGTVSYKTKYNLDGTKNHEIEYYFGGDIKIKTHFDDKNSITSKLKFYETGVLKEELNYNNNKLDGKQEYFDENGNLIESKEFKENQLTGWVLKYDENQKVIEKKRYFKNEEITDKLTINLLDELEYLKYKFDNCKLGNFWDYHRLDIDPHKIKTIFNFMKKYFKTKNIKEISKIFKEVIDEK